MVIKGMGSDHWGDWDMVLCEGLFTVAIFAAISSAISFF
jgi:hypothetical protein